MKDSKEKNILFLTDIHQAYDNLEKIDFLSYDGVICAGDIVDPAHTNIELSVKILEKLPEDTYIIPGNCDKDVNVYSKIIHMKNCIERKTGLLYNIPIGGLGKAGLLEKDIEIYRQFFIEDLTRVDEFVKSGGPMFILKFTGITADKKVYSNDDIIKNSFDFFNKFISYNDEDIEYVFKDSCLENGIFVTHSPVFGKLDKLPGLPNIGSRGALKCVENAEPALVLSGHFHELSGMFIDKGTCYFNPGAFKDGFYGEIVLSDDNIRTIRKCSLSSGEQTSMDL